MHNLMDDVRACRPLSLDGIVDMHGHYGPTMSFAAWGHDADDMIAEMDRVGVRKLVCSHHAVLTAEIEYGNKEVLSAMRRHPDRILGYATSFPLVKRLGLDEIKRCIDGGMVGVKMHSDNNIPYASPLYRDIWRYANDNRLPVLLHTRGGLDKLDPVLTEYRDTPILLAHAGAVQPAAYVECARKNPQVILDVAFSGCRYGLVEYFVRELSARRVVFGSDMPFLSLAQQIGKVVFADITEAQKRLILEENAQRILDHRRR